MIEILTGITLLLGGFFALVAGWGILKLPDVLTRMHASTKAGTLGSMLTLTAAALTFGEMSVVMRCVIGVLFLLLTAPIAAHMIGRASARKQNFF